MIRKTLAATAIVSVAMLAPAAPALADHGPRDDKGKNATRVHENHGKHHAYGHLFREGRFAHGRGLITAVDAANDTLTVAFRVGRPRHAEIKTVTIAVTDDTRIRRNRAKAELEDLQVNDRARIKAKQVDGTWTAVRVGAFS